MLIILEVILGVCVVIILVQLKIIQTPSIFVQIMLIVSTPVLMLIVCLEMIVNVLKMPQKHLLSILFLPTLYTVVLIHIVFSLCTSLNIWTLPSLTPERC
eukprot:c23340_g1_i1.p2 GENE.c23340_g1_i1~~c23340_g1_i1.p2  ORF type:complete len:100 (+),score=2.79 c23340_g1_i1:425-724(+)